MIVNFYIITWFNNTFCGSIYWAVSRFVVPLYFNPKKLMLTLVLTRNYGVAWNTPMFVQKYKGEIFLNLEIIFSRMFMHYIYIKGMTKLIWI